MVKFRTPFFAIMYKANSDMPKDVQASVEHELHMVVNLFSATLMDGDIHGRFLAAITEFCIKESIVIADNVRGISVPLTPICEDWKRGLRNPHGCCTNCGGKH